MYILLIIIISSLIYIAFFTPEKMREREIKRVQKLFNTPISEPPSFKIDDPRNETHPEEMVVYESEGQKTMSHRKLAVLFYQMEEKLKNIDNR